MSFPDRTRVAIIGGGPAGLVLALLLARAGIDCAILERETRADVLSRIGSGILEPNSVDVLRLAGVAGRLDREGIVHDDVEIAFGERILAIPLRELTGGHTVTVYGQNEVTKDLYDAVDASGISLFDGVSDVCPIDIETDAPAVTYRTKDGPQRLECDFIAGCDGKNGACRAVLPSAAVKSFGHRFPAAWLGVLTQTAPMRAKLVYSRSERGFALLSMRSETMARFHLECGTNDTPADWPDDRIHAELVARLPSDLAADLTPSITIEKTIKRLDGLVVEPMSHGRLFLAGDAAHLVPAPGAKGLNLAIADARQLAQALVANYHERNTDLLDSYGETALARIWKVERFVSWFTKLLHRPTNDDAFEARLQHAEFDLLATSLTAQKLFAENYVGMPR